MKTVEPVPIRPRQVCRPLGLVPPLSKTDLLRVLPAYGIEARCSGRCGRVRAICYPGEIELWRDRLADVDAAELAHQLCHVLYHRDIVNPFGGGAFYLCRRPALRGCEAAEDEADAFARALVGDSDR